MLVNVAFCFARKFFTSSALEASSRFTPMTTSPFAEYFSCFSTSFGLFDEQKVFVSLDLGERYANVHALREGVELLRLY